MLNTGMILGLVRHGLTLAGGYLVSKGHLDIEAAETISGALLAIIGSLWSIKSKKV